MALQVNLTALGIDIEFGRDIMVAGLLRQLTTGLDLGCTRNIYFPNVGGDTGWTILLFI